MKIVTITIPEPDFRMSDIVKRKTEDFANRWLSRGLIHTTASGLKGDIEDFYADIDNHLDSFKKDSYKLLAIKELLVHLADLYLHGYSNASEIDNKNYLETIRFLQFYLYDFSSSLGYSLDAETFSNEEISVKSEKIDEIIDSLNEIRLGEEILYNEIDQLKADFNDLKSSFPDGKKKWYYQISGMLANYAASTVADSLIEPIKPQIRSLFINYSQEIVQRLLG